MLHYEYVAEQVILILVYIDQAKPVVYWVP
jgi:hypothetical protein